ncbi:MAG: peptidoglycan-binding protein LysM [Pseudomonadota bacterium]
MGLFNFVKSIGEKLGGGAKVDAASLAAHVKALGLPVEKLLLSVSEDKETVDVFGYVPELAVKEKLILAIGNIDGVGKVNDHIRIGVPAAPVNVAPVPTTVAEAVAAEPVAPEVLPTSVFYTVEKGDTLSKIAKTHYGNANAYNAIFEANKPMLKHPDKIFPGQVLRIPPKD